MQNFIYNDEFYHELEDLIENLFGFRADIEELPDDWSIECNRCNLEPLETLSADWIVERIDEERLSEDGDELDVLHKILRENIDFDKINSLMPKLWYEQTYKGKFTITKQDLINSL